MSACSKNSSVIVEDSQNVESSTNNFDKEEHHSNDDGICVPDVTIGERENVGYESHDSKSDDEVAIVDIPNVKEEPIDDKLSISNSILFEKEAYDDDFIRESTYKENSYGFFIGASLRGKSHKESGTECQDFHLYSQIGEGWHVLIVSDGAGSAKFAGRGSKGNCTVALHLLSEMISKNHWIENDVLPSELEWYIQCRSIFEQMKLIYRNRVAEIGGETKETDFSATIILCVITPKGMLAAHIGDGRMGYLTKENEWRSLMVPHKGEEANQTLFLQNSWTTPQVPAFKVSGVFVPEIRVVPEVPQALILMSDGCERASWQCVMFDECIGKYIDKNKPHPEFMNPLIDAILQEYPDGRLQLLIDIMDRGTRVCKQERDDKTMLLAIVRKEEDGRLQGSD